MLRIDAQAHRQVDRLVELGVLYFLQERHGFLKRIRLCFHGGPRLIDVLSGFLHVLLVSHRRSLMPSGRGVYDLSHIVGQTYAVTSIPMERAVPFTLLTAASTEAAFRSGIFCLAISSTCFSVTLPTLSLLGVPEPLATPAARFSRIAAGGVLVMKLKVRSLYTLTTTGIIRPSSSLALVFD